MFASIGMLVADSSWGADEKLTPVKISAIKTRCLGETALLPRIGAVNTIAVIRTNINMKAEATALPYPSMFPFGLRLKR